MRQFYFARTFLATRAISAASPVSMRPDAPMPPSSISELLLLRAIPEMPALMPATSIWLVYSVDRKKLGRRVVHNKGGTNPVGVELCILKVFLYTKDLWALRQKWKIQTITKICIGR